MKRNLMFCLTIGLLMFGSIGIVNADTIALDITGGDNNTNGIWTLGFSFSVVDDITVTALGIYDDNQDGLLYSHNLGLWDSSGSLLASTSILDGQSGQLFGSFRFTSISPIDLLSGNTYTVGAGFAEHVGDVWVSDATITTIPEINYIERRYSSGWTYPASAGSATNGYFGASFLVGNGENLVPEPSTMLLLGVGLIGLAGATRRKLKK